MEPGHAAGHGVYGAHDFTYPRCLSLIWSVVSASDLMLWLRSYSTLIATILHFTAHGSTNEQ